MYNIDTESDYYYSRYRDINSGPENFGWWMFGLPLAVLGLVFVLATGLWPLLLLGWFLLKLRKRLR